MMFVLRSTSNYTSFKYMCLIFFNKPNTLLKSYVIIIYGWPPVSPVSLFQCPNLFIDVCSNVNSMAMHI